MSTENVATIDEQVNPPHVCPLCGEVLEPYVTYTCICWKSMCIGCYPDHLRKCVPSGHAIIMGSELDVEKQISEVTLRHRKAERDGAR